LAFLHVHHEDLKHAIEMAGPNLVSSQETWQRVFRDAERAVMRKVGDAFPELGYLPGPARELVLWQRVGFAGQEGLYPTACNQYRASMNMVADWAKDRGLMDHSGPECVPTDVSLLHALTTDRSRVAALQRHDGLGPDIVVGAPPVATEPTTDEVERLISEVPIFAMVGADDVRALAAGARPLFLGHTQRLVVEGNAGTSLFLVGDGAVEVRRRNASGGDDLVETLGRGEVVGEMALLTGEARSATVRSVDETVVYEISRQLYEPLVRKHPEWLDELAAIMERRLDERAANIASHQTLPRSTLVARLRSSLLG
jgi:CRP-like cAMP-binding protein